MVNNNLSKTLLLDVDGVVADCSSQVHRFAENLFLRRLPKPATWTSWEFSAALELTPHEAGQFYEQVKHSGVADHITFYPGAREIVHELCDAFDLVFVTSHWKQYPAWVPARERLLEEFKRPIIFTHEKWRVHGEYLCDDHPKNLEQGSFYPLLFDASHNKTSTLHRVYSLRELLEYK